MEPVKHYAREPHKSTTALYNGISLSHMSGYPLNRRVDKKGITFTKRGKEALYNARKKTLPEECFPDSNRYYAYPSKNSKDKANFESTLVHVRVMELEVELAVRSAINSAQLKWGLISSVLSMSCDHDFEIQQFVDRPSEVLDNVPSTPSTNSNTRRPSPQLTPTGTSGLTSYNEYLKTTGDKKFKTPKHCRMYWKIPLKYKKSGPTTDVAKYRKNNDGCMTSITSEYTLALIDTTTAYIQSKQEETVDPRTNPVLYRNVRLPNRKDANAHNANPLQYNYTDKDQPFDIKYKPGKEPSFFDIIAVRFSETVDCYISTYMIVFRSSKAGTSIYQTKAGHACHEAFRLYSELHGNLLPLVNKNDGKINGSHISKVYMDDLYDYRIRKSTRNSPSVQLCDEESNETKGSARRLLRYKDGQDSGTSKNKRNITDNNNSPTKRSKTSDLGAEVNQEMPVVEENSVSGTVVTATATATTTATSMKKVTSKATATVKSKVISTTTKLSKKGKSKIQKQQIGVAKMTTTTTVTTATATAETIIVPAKPPLPVKSSKTKEVVPINSTKLTSPLTRIESPLTRSQSQLTRRQSPLTRSQSPLTRNNSKRTISYGRASAKSNQLRKVILDEEDEDTVTDSSVFDATQSGTPSKSKNKVLINSEDDMEGNEAVGTGLSESPVESYDYLCPELVRSYQKEMGLGSSTVFEKIKNEGIMALYQVVVLKLTASILREYPLIQSTDKGATTTITNFRDEYKSLSLVVKKIQRAIKSRDGSNSVRVVGPLLCNDVTNKGQPVLLIVFRLSTDLDSIRLTVAKKEQPYFDRANKETFVHCRIVVLEETTDDKSMDCYKSLYQLSNPLFVEKQKKSQSLIDTAVTVPNNVMNKATTDEQLDLITIPPVDIELPEDFKSKISQKVLYNRIVVNSSRLPESIRQVQRIVKDLGTFELFTKFFTPKTCAQALLHEDGIADKSKRAKIKAEFKQRITIIADDAKRRCIFIATEGQKSTVESKVSKANSYLYFIKHRSEEGWYTLAWSILSRILQRLTTESDRPGAEESVYLIEVVPMTKVFAKIFYFVTNSQWSVNLPTLSELPVKFPYLSDGEIKYKLLVLFLEQPEKHLTATVSLPRYVFIELILIICELHYAPFGNKGLRTNSFSGKSGDDKERKREQEISAKILDKENSPTADDCHSCRSEGLYTLDKLLNGPVSSMQAITIFQLYFC